MSTRDCQHASIHQRAGELSLMSQMREPAGSGFQHIEARITGSNPKAPFVVECKSRDIIARQRLRVNGLVAVKSEAVGVAVPACQATIGNRDP